MRTLNGFDSFTNADQAKREVRASLFLFVRIHKTHLVNFKHLISYEKANGGMLLLSNGAKVPVSGRRKYVVKRLFRAI